MSTTFIDNKINETSPWVMSYGEAYTHLKMNVKMVEGEWINIPVPKHKPKMSRAEATEYYSSKFARYWKENKGV